ncbi:respiratory chain complex I subunit 1 family protein [Thermococcus barophilus]|uniref:Membrane bound subgroup 4b [NiFe]-hydrogenase MBH(B)3, subunit Mbh(B)3M n=1 Tax=Thermococcus barophilus TaxID=55802 RepID=A0A0S1XD09_THEBA|nr:NADH-quinone oxidoreductase subunit H [Thermococcus barophilus]ALM75671.1 Membrane bound subgroup 4b [NiFe]-hydrogenase MBH(b)3, subunit Mbh(b)3M [Thermococcus barophilus]
MIERAILGLVAITIIMFLPPLLDGIARKIRATLQARQGPPIFQTYYDLASLLSMDSNSPTDRFGFMIAPYVAFAAALAAGFVLPFGNFIPVAFTGDLFVFLYVLAISSIAFMMAGFLVENTYANAGANREMMIILSIEPVLGIAIGVLALKSGTLSISGIPLNLTFAPSVLLALALLAYAVYVECAFIPFDIAEAETEIIEGPLAEYSGRLLGIFKWAMLIKRVTLIWLFSGIVVLPFFKDVLSTTLGSIAALLCQLVVLFVFYALAAVIEATSARLKIIQAIKQNTIVFVLGIVVLAMASVGW